MILNHLFKAVTDKKSKKESSFSGVFKIYIKKSAIGNKIKI